jgi:hypothetical protein
MEREHQQHRRLCLTKICNDCDYKYEGFSERMMRREARMSCRPLNSLLCLPQLRMVFER